MDGQKHVLRIQALEKQVESFKLQNEKNKGEAVKIMSEMKAHRVENEQEIQKQFMDLFIKYQELETTYGELV